MPNGEKKIVSVGSRLAGFIGAKASREKKLQAAAMQAEFTLHDTLIILSYLSRDTDPEISSQARKNLIPAARNWFNRPDRPELPEPIREIVMKVIEKVGLGEKAETGGPAGQTVGGNIGLLGLGELLQAIDHNNRTAHITLSRGRYRDGLHGKRKGGGRGGGRRGRPWSCLQGFRVDRCLVPICACFARRF